MRALNVESTMYLYNGVQKCKTASGNASILHLLVFIILTYINYNLSERFVPFVPMMPTLNISYSFYVIKYKTSNMYGFNLMLNPTVYTYVFNFQLLFP